MLHHTAISCVCQLFFLSTILEVLKCGALRSAPYSSYLPLLSVIRGYIILFQNLDTWCPESLPGRCRQRQAYRTHFGRPSVPSGHHFQPQRLHGMCGCGDDAHWSDDGASTAVYLRS